MSRTNTDSLAQDVIELHDARELIDRARVKLMSRFTVPGMAFHPEHYNPILEALDNASTRVENWRAEVLNDLRRAVTDELVDERIKALSEKARGNR